MNDSAKTVIAGSRRKRIIPRFTPSRKCQPAVRSGAVKMLEFGIAELPVRLTARPHFTPISQVSPGSESRSYSKADDAHLSRVCFFRFFVLVVVVVAERR